MAVGGPVARTLSVLIFVALGVCTVLSTQSLTMPMVHERFVFEGVATGAGWLAIGLTILLSAYQKDIYWVNRRQAVKLDERQLRMRQVVFEQSYKQGVILVVLFGVFGPDASADAIKAIFSANAGTIPGHYFWPWWNMLTALLALPLVIAAWHRPAK